MSWDLIVFDFEEALSDPETGTAVFPDTWEPPIIGDASTVRTIIDGVFLQVSWADPNWGTVVDADFSLEFNLSSEEAISSFTIHARGHATPAILKLVSATGWRILDISTGRWMHEASNPDEGREAFQRYLNSVRETEVVAKNPFWLKRLF